MSKTTVEKVIEGLECKGTTGSNCKECQFRGNGEDCSVLAMQAAALIKSQEKRIKELEAQVDAEQWHDISDILVDHPKNGERVFVQVDKYWEFDSAVFFFNDDEWFFRNYLYGEVLRWKYINPETEENNEAD